MIKNINILFLTILFCFINWFLHAQPGCPSIDAGPNQTLSCTTPCTNLTATVFATGASTSYAVTSIPYNPPYPYNSGTPILDSIDDTWSSVITLPFTFCFYGNSYNQIIVGSNGLISFNTSLAGGFCSWMYSASVPSSLLHKNAIFGPFHDINPAVLGSGLMYYAILGNYPCRTFVISWNQIPMYSCTTLIATHQIVLYESTNVIEVYIQNKPLCSTWNSGNACIAVHNSTGTAGVCPPGRNTGQWTATNEAWRFTPNGTPNYTVSWWQGYTQIGTTSTINVCPTTTTTYTAQVIYDCCNGSQVTLTDDIDVIANNIINLAINPLNPTICTGTTATLTATSSDPSATFQWSNGSAGNTITVNPTSTTIYTVTATTPSCTTDTSVTVTVLNNPVVPVNNDTICSGQSATLTATGANSYLWSTGSTDSTIIVSPASTTIYTVTGTYTGCTGTGAGTVTVVPQPNAQITSSGDATCGLDNGTATASGGADYLWSNGQDSSTAVGLAPGNYIVTVSNIAGCSSTASVTINDLPLPVATITSTNETCGHSNGTATTNTTGSCSQGFTYLWNTIPPQTTQTATNLPAGSYIVTVSCSGCTSSATTTITNMAGPSASISNIVDETCGLANGSATVTANGGTHPYSYLWDCSPTQNTSTMSNVSAGTYSVTVTDSNACVAVNIAVISGSPGLTTTISSTNEICNKSDGTATVVVSGGTGTYYYLWNTNPSQTTATATGLPAGTYIVTVTDSTCTSTIQTTLINFPGPTAGFTAHPEVLTSLDGPVSFLDNSTGNIVNWLWNFGDGSIDSSGNNETQHEYINLGIYIVTLIITDNNGCKDTITDTVKVKEIYTLYISNAFTPNNNGKNDLFYAQGINIDPNNFEMTIFDRWGNVMFITDKWIDTQSEGWNGTLNNKGTKDNIVMDVYVYRIRVKEIDGPKREYVGRVFLLP